MARTKKVKEEEVKVESKLNEVEKPVDYGTGWTGKNNRIQAELRGEVEKK